MFYLLTTEAFPRLSCRDGTFVCSRIANCRRPLHRAYSGPRKPGANRAVWKPACRRISA